MDFYHYLLKQQKEGQQLTKDDVDARSLYRLSIIQNIPDRLIGELYHLTKNQVIYRRHKYGIDNIFLTKSVQDREKILKKAGIDPDHFEDPVINQAFNQSLTTYAETRGFNLDFLNHLLEQKKTIPVEPKELSHIQTLSLEELRAKLPSPSSKQKSINPYVKAYVLKRADGKCDLCGKPAPFQKLDNTPYLETHHIVYQQYSGPDHIYNLVALCPNCHKKIHNRQEDQDYQKLITRIETYITLYDPIFLPQLDQLFFEKKKEN